MLKSLPVHIIFALIISSVIMIIGHQLVQISNKNAQEKIMMYEEKIQQLEDLVIAVNESNQIKSK